MRHIPVLLEEAIEWLKLSQAESFIDATLDGGGHTLAVLERFPAIKVLGIEYDPVEFGEIESRIKNLESRDRLIVTNDSYANMKVITRGHDFHPDAILFDLGVSSWHYESSGRGFSFQKNEMLDMRFNPQLQERTASDLVNQESEDELERILAEYGEEKFSKEIAQKIVEAREVAPILSTEDLIRVVASAVPGWYKRQKIHPSTKTFQALRMAVNNELNVIREGIMSAIDVLRSGGRLAVISFHGLEDLLVREVFKKQSSAGVGKWATKRTIRPSWNEIKSNPRARSAKMKVFEKI